MPRTTNTANKRERAVLAAPYAEAAPIQWNLSRLLPGD